MPLNPDMLVKLSTGRWRVDVFGRWYPDICGGDGPEDDEGDDETEGDEGSDDKPPAKTFTQKDLDRHATKQQREGKRKAIRELMERFDFASVEEAEAFIEAAREKADKSGDDDIKRQKRLEDRERKAEEREREATRKANTADIVSFLVSEGLSRAEARRAARLVEVDLDSDELDDDDIADAVDELKETMPRLFGTVDEEDEEEKPRTRRTPDSTPRGKKPPSKSGSDMKDLGRSRLTARHGDKLKSA